jgi:hypothetical protein
VGREGLRGGRNREGKARPREEKKGRRAAEKWSGGGRGKETIDRDRKGSGALGTSGKGFVDDT